MLGAMSDDLQRQHKNIMTTCQMLAHLQELFVLEIVSQSQLSACWWLCSFLYLYINYELIKIIWAFFITKYFIF